MKRLCLVVVSLLLIALAGCGDSNDHAPIFVARILSNANLDGDIAKTTGPGTAIYTINQGNSQSYFAGFDPADGAELRTFLHFDLTGAGGVPGTATIASATLDFFVDSILPNQLSTSVPLRLDLVDLDPPALVADDYERNLQPALASMTISPPITLSDFGQHVTVDVTTLMREAQRLNLPRFQLRILRDPGTTIPGLVEINDTTGVNRNVLAPLLEVSYF